MAFSSKAVVAWSRSGAFTVLSCLISFNVEYCSAVSSRVVMLISCTYNLESSR